MLFPCLETECEKKKMGVPAFYRWLVGKYPKVVMNAVENDEDPTLPNPNGFEFDNLYLDMNGFIHPCFHPDNDLEGPTTMDEVFRRIFQYIDRLFRIVRPRKLLYMAIDGVAPRAKMNQQRSRRFNTAKQAEIAEAEEEKLRKQFDLERRRVLPRKQSEVDDSNVITPGTEFMDKLSNAVKYYIRLRLNTDPGWKAIKVILSDANVPGEGEHKIMSFIRLQRNLDGYNPNTRHCLYGLDADLIMLALATHEVHFSILREDVLTRDKQQSYTMPFQKVDDKNKDKSRGLSGRSIASNRLITKTLYQFLNIWTLREYLELELTIPDSSFQINFERVLDDFIFMCFFMGNDFLPHLLTLEIHECGIDLLIAVYKSEFKNMGGYLVDTHRLKEKKAAYIKMKRLERFITAVGSYEDQIFQKRSEIRHSLLKRILSERSEELKEKEMDDVEEDVLDEAITGMSDCNTRRGCARTQKVKSVHFRSEHMCVSQREIASVVDVESDNSDDCSAVENTKELLQKVKDSLRDQSDMLKHGILPTDKVKLGQPGWKERYYKLKFLAEKPDQIESMRKDVVQKYTEGLCWVLRYYYEGVCSWTWYYKYYYGPFASDFKGLVGSAINFHTSTPFEPFTQLMAVLPPRSAHALPVSYGNLMTSEDSKIRDFYPSNFEVDIDGKRYTWQGVTRLPFIEEKLLLQEIEKRKSELTDDEVRRNSVSLDKIFVRKSHELGALVTSMYDRCYQDSNKVKTQTKVPIDHQNSGGMNGFLSTCSEQSGVHNITSPVQGIDDIIEDAVICAIFENPMFHDHFPEPPQNVVMPEKILTKDDYEETPLWHKYRGPRPSIHRSNMRAGNELEIKSSNSSDTEKSRGAGVGWGGRGRGSFEKLNSHNSGSSAGIHPLNRYIGESRNGSSAQRSVSHWNGSAQTFASNGRGRGNAYSGALNVSGNSINCNQILSRNHVFGQQPRRVSMADRSDTWHHDSSSSSLGRGFGKGVSGSSSSNLRWVVKPNQINPTTDDKGS